MRVILFLILIQGNLFSQNQFFENYYVSHYTTKNGLPSNCLYRATVDNKGYVWFGTENGLSRFDGREFLNIGLKEGLKDNAIFGVYAFESKILAFSFKGADLISTSNRVSKNKNEFFSNGKVGSILFEDRIGNNYYSVSFDSIYIYNVANPQNVVLVGKSNYLDNGIDAPLYYFFKKNNDRDNHIQLIYNQNFIVYNVGRKEIKIYETQKDSIHNVEIPNKIKEIRSISNYENKLFINDFNSFYEYEIVNFRLIFKKKVTFQCTINSVFYKDGLYYVNTLTDGVYVLREKGKNININLLQISSIDVDANNQIVVGIKDNFPKHYNCIGKKTIPQSIGTIKSKPILVNNQIAWINDYTIDYSQKKHTIYDLIKTVKVYNTDTLLVGTRSYALLYDLKSGKKVKHILNKWTVDFCLTKTKDIYIASPSGLYRYGNDGQVRKIKFTNYENLKVNSVAEDLQGNIWINTAGLGIFVYNPFSKKIQNLQTKEGLLSDNNSNIIIDKKNRKWILSNFGVLVIDGKRFFKINESEGLMSNEIIDLKVINDTAWIASNLGLNKFVYVNSNDKIWIPLNINEVKINNQLVDSMPKRLTPVQNKIQFNFIGIYIAASDEIKYNYRLSFDNSKGKWQKTDQNQLVFENLQFGKYVLEIEAYHANYPNIRSKIIKIPFVINPHFYQTFVFWIVMFLLLLLVSSYFIFKIVKQRKQRELEKAELLAKVNESNLKSLQGQMNPHFVFNSLSTLQNLVLNQKDAEVLEYISEFSKLMRSMLDNSRNDIISLVDEVDFLKNYIDLEHIRYKNSFDVIWTNLLAEDDFEEIYIPTMLVQPLIENAIKHGVSNLNERRGIIEISLNLINKSLLEIKVQDNGSNNVSKNIKHTSTAIKVIKERLELYQKNNQKGTFELIIRPDGASSIITIPV